METNRKLVLGLALICIFLLISMSVVNCQVDSTLENSLEKRVYQPNTTMLMKAPDTCLNVETIISAAKQLKELRSRTSTQAAIIDALELELSQTRKLNNQNKSIIKLQEKEIEIYSNITENFKELTGKTPWYRTNEFHFISGMVIGGAAIYLGARAIR